MLVKITNSGAAQVNGLPANSVLYGHINHNSVVQTNATGTITAARLNNTAQASMLWTPSSTLRIQLGTIGDGGFFRAILDSV